MQARAGRQRKAALVLCGFCRGKGKDPFGIMSELAVCCVCGGQGLVLVQAPYVRCAHCQGTGAVKTLTCTVCRGKGYVSAPEGQTVRCADCRGTGDDASAPAMACLRCRGRGWLPITIAEEAVNQESTAGIQTPRGS